MKRVVAMVDVSAIERNARRLTEALAGGSELCAVVKADGYGHGAGQAAAAALRGGAGALAVATAAEAAEIRAEMPSERVIVMGALSLEEIDLALGAGAEIAAWREATVDVLAARASALGVVPRVHVKHDSGMGRLGERDPASVLAVADAVAADERLDLAAVWTHFATADDPDDSFLHTQLAAFERVASAARERHPGVALHAANSAATLREPKAHFDMVRCGVALYGLDPFGRDPREQQLEPAMSLISYVADVKTFEPGASAGYGRTWTADRQTLIAPVPIGYGDGFRRGLTNRAEALIGGKRHPVVGTISMDNVTVDLGPETAVEPFDEVVLLGERGAERILAEDLARELGTINYEITCGISARVPRVYLGS